MIDEWSGLADFLATMIEKYASELSLDDLPDQESDRKNICVKKIIKTDLDNKAAA